MRKALTIAVLAGASFAWGQAPSDADAAALIEKGREKALAYAESLPDFVATEVIRRYTGVPGTNFSHRTPTDSLTIQLRYFQHREEHKLIQYNGEPTNAVFEKLEGLRGSGEFGITISAIFKPESQTGFHFEKWITVRRRPAARLAYEVDAAHTRYVLQSKIYGQEVAAAVSYHGILEIDAETGEVLHLEYVADHIPKELRVLHAASAVDYALADIGGREYLLPSHSEMELHGHESWEKNVIEFRDYRKFSADSSIEFGPVK
jgi:hypothetical protein